MSKTVLVNVVERKNPTKPTEAGKFYASAVTSGEKTIEEIAEEIESSCTVTSQDIVAVIEALRKRIIVGLQNGEIIRLGNIGYLRLSVGSKGTAKKEDFAISQITRAKILFTPCSTLRDMLKTLSFEINKGATAADASGTSGTSGGTSSGTSGGTSSGTSGGTSSGTSGGTSSGTSSGTSGGTSGGSDDMAGA